MKASGVNTLFRIGVNSDVLDGEISVYEQYKDQTQDLVKDIVGLPVDEQCRAIFAYVADHVQYKLDPNGIQYIKSPARLLADGEGDCKSLTLFINSCLHCLGVTHIFRFVNFDGGRQYSHVYPVAIDEQGREIVLDECETDGSGRPIYNYARNYKKKKDYTFYE